MRIRKHAKISPQLLSASAISSSHSLLQTHMCQLNQSPWDVIIFPPTEDSTSPPLPPYLQSMQVDGDDSTGNGSLGDSVGAVESSVAEDTDNKSDQIGAVLCCKTDGKGWKCRREKKEGHTLCEHHLAQLRNYNTSLKSDLPAAAPVDHRRRPRAKKSSSAAAASSPNEFYYYSGFGPRWGKKRGNGRGGEVNKRVEGIVESVIEASATPSSSVSIISNEELDYVEDEDDEEEEEMKGEIGKKRARKPIKARSLKSLM